MEITAALAADLALLTEALDEPGTDIAATLRQLAADARSAVPSYLGLTLVVPGALPPVRITAMDDHAVVRDVATSVLVPIVDGAGPGRPSAALVLYAATPGAFTDLTADLSWLTGAALTEFVLDGHRHLGGRAGSDGAVRAESIVSQAIGVLIGRGYLPEDAARELETRAAADGGDRFAVATAILDGLPSVMEAADGYDLGMTGFDDSTPPPSPADPGADAAVAAATSDDDRDAAATQEPGPGESSDETAPEFPS